MKTVDYTNGLIWTIFGVILLYFMLGGMGFYFINRKKPKTEARKSYLKFGTYFVIINLLFFSIVWNSSVFQLVSLIIIIIGFYEMYRVFVRADFTKRSFFIWSALLYGILSSGFFAYSTLTGELILFSFLITSIFDSFSQITGQLWGRKKLVPTISPQKTVGGVTGGAVVAMISGYLLHNLYPVPLYRLVILVTGTVIFAFAGDLLASYYKRTFGVKDYSNFIPGHGGFLDRFDSLIVAGAWVAFYVFITN